MDIFVVIGLILGMLVILIPLTLFLLWMYIAKG